MKCFCWSKCWHCHLSLIIRIFILNCFFPMLFSNESASNSATVITVWNRPFYALNENPPPKKQKKSRIFIINCVSFVDLTLSALHIVHWIRLLLFCNMCTHQSAFHMRFCWNKFRWMPQIEVENSKHSRILFFSVNWFDHAESFRKTTHCFLFCSILFRMLTHRRFFTVHVFVFVLINFPFSCILKSLLPFSDRTGTESEYSLLTTCCGSQRKLFINVCLKSWSFSSKSYFRLYLSQQFTFISISLGQAFDYPFKLLSFKKN